MDLAIFAAWCLLVLIDYFLLAARAVWRFLYPCCPSSPRSKEVVIVGASFGGLAVYRELLGHHEINITLVDFKDYFEYTPGVLRCFVDPGYLRRLTCPLPNSRSKLVAGEVVGVSQTSVSVRRSDGSRFELGFDYLVLACGSTYQEPIKPVAVEATLVERQASWRRAHERLRAAESVAIVGAGAVGLELAGEILTVLPQKKVSIFDMAPTILPGFPARCTEHAHAWLGRMGVELRLGESIADIGADSITLGSGETVRAGVVYKCMGVMPNTGMIKGSPFAEAFGFRDSINVNDHLQITGHPNVFCVGDMMSHSSRELKLGHTAEVNGHLVAHNIVALVEGSPLLEYPQGVVGAKTTPKIFCLSLGKYDASLGFNWLVLNGWLPALMKWLLEWTKVAAAAERPVGVLFWLVADVMSNLLGRTLLSGAAR